MAIEVLRRGPVGFTDAEAEDFRQKLLRVREEIHKEIVGLDHAIDALIIALLAGVSRRGHILFEAAPGRGKTLLVKVLAQTLNLEYSRVQGTPDHEPLDFYYAHQIAGRGIKEILFKKGPIFTNVLLVDELNRVPEKAQSGLLQVMEEGAVTFEEKLEQLPHFHLLATQNPIETKGTYGIAEALADRFMFKIFVDFPDEEILRRIIARDPRPKILTKILNLKELDLWSERVYDAYVKKLNPDSTMVKYISRLIRNAYLHPAKLGGIRGESPSVRPGEDLKIIAGINAFINGKDKPSQEDAVLWLAPALRGRYPVNKRVAQELGFAGGHINEITDSVIKDILEKTPFV